MSNSSSQRFIEAFMFEPESLVLPHSWAGHIPFATWLIAGLKPKVFVELGTHTANSYFAFCQTVKQNKLSTRCFAVDTWEGDKQAGQYDETVFEAVSRRNADHYGSFSTLLRMLFDDALQHFDDGSVDLLHIDGLHTYEAVRHDFETWKPKLSKNAVVLFHDTQVRKEDFGVHKFWRELKDQYKNHFEFKHSNGLGVLFLGSVPPFISKDTELLIEAPYDLDLFAKSGERLVGKLAVLEEKQVLNEHLVRMHERELFIIETHKVIEARDEEISGLRSELKKQLFQASEANNALEQTVDRLQTELHAITNSTSWKITYPLRALIGNARRNSVRTFSIARFFLRFVRHIIVNPKAGMAAAQKAIGVYRRSGFTGLRAAIRQKHVEARDYGSWVNQFAKPSIDQRVQMQQYLLTQDDLPTISIVLPVYRPDPKFLSAAIKSVKEQIYPNWQLCLVDDCSKSQEIETIITAAAAADPRIKVHLSQENGHISKASNIGVEMATGEWVTFLDHDDELAPDALYWVFKTINENPEVSMIYSDEDKIDENGNRSEPNFKPDWNPELFRSYNMVTHLAIYRRDIVNEVGGLRVGFEGAQDYDLALRYVDKISKSQIYHIPRILYHWRIHEMSTAMENDAKPYALLAGQKALQEHLDRNKVKGEVEIVDEFYRIQYQLPKKQPLVSIIIPTHNGADILKTCVESIFEKTTYKNFEIIIVDNRSNDPEALAYFDTLAGDKRVKLVKDDRPFNYSAINNRAVEASSGELIAFMNNDIEVISEIWLEELVRIALQPEYGAVGAKLYYPDDTVQHAGVITGLGGVAGHAHKHFPRGARGYMKRLIVRSNLSAVTAACLVVRRAVFEEVGGFEEENLAVAFNDVDLCLKIDQAGYRNVWTPFAELYHHESKTRGYEDTPEKQKRFVGEVEYMQSKWSDRLKLDPSYNVNLTLDSEDFALAFPPRHSTGDDTNHAIST